MSFFLNNTPLVHHQNLISMFNSCQSVSNHNHGFSHCEFADCLLNQMLILWINTRCSLIQNYNRRIF